MQKDCFEELDVEQFEIVATLDSHTSELCRNMDGKHFPMSQWEIGVTAPPFHVWCRSTTVPYFEDNFGVTGERAARGEDGKTYYVPADMTYKEWQKAFVEGDKTGLQEIRPDAIINLSYEEQLALNRYLSSDSYKINDKLRNGVELTGDDKQFVHHLDHALNKIPNYQGNLLRCVDIKDKESARKFIDSFVIDQRKIFDEYISTSKNGGYNPEANILIYIQNSTRGKDITGYNPKEAEVLYM